MLEQCPKADGTLLGPGDVSMGGGPSGDELEVGCGCIAGAAAHAGAASAGAFSGAGLEVSVAEQVALLAAVAPMTGHASHLSPFSSERLIAQQACQCVWKETGADS